MNQTDQTRIIRVNPLSFDPSQLLPAVKALQNGEVVAFPTETVYGLGGNAWDITAISRIYEAKGRPQDNPLIVHIADKNELPPLVSHIPPKASLLIDAFWPGPLTLILKRNPKLPGNVSAGLPSLAVRFPSHPVAKALIHSCGFPLAAPSANRSGYPSPTSASHVWDDLKGRIPFLIDGGETQIGLESTVLSFLSQVPTLLRPGKITLEAIEAVIGPVQLDPGVLHPVEQNASVLSPGMKYRHYSPDTRLFLFEGSSKDYAAYCNQQKNTVALCFLEDLPLLSIPAISYGSQKNPESLAHHLFSCLRLLDKKPQEIAIAHAPRPEGEGLSVSNRLLRSAGFEVIAHE